jgi:hypothetical protein
MHKKPNTFTKNKEDNCGREKATCTAAGLARPINERVGNRY